MGWLRTASSFEGTVNARPASEMIGDLSYTGSGLAVDAAIGGSLMRGLAFGYGFAWQLADDPTLHVENTAAADGDTERHQPLGASIHGLMVDVFPDPSGNLELGGLVGLGTVGTGGGDNGSTGFAAQIWGGYGLWAAKELSLIALLRLSFARTTDEQIGPTSFVNGTPTQTTTAIDRTDTTFTVGVVTGLLVH
jgi:hypothetical protein